MISKLEKSYEHSPMEEWAFGQICSPEGWSPDRISTYKKSIHDAFQALLPDKVITFVDSTIFNIDADTGAVMPPSWFGSSKRDIQTSAKRIKCINDFCSADFKAKYVYIYRVEPEEVFGGLPGQISCVYIQMAEYHPTDRQADPVITREDLEKLGQTGMLDISTKSKKFYGDPRDEAWGWINSGLGFDPEHIELNKSTLEKYLKTLLPSTVISFIKEPGLDKVHKFWDAPYVTIDTETGTILDDDSDLTTKKVLKTKTFTVPGQEYFNSEWFGCKYLYIYKIVKHGTGVEIVAAEYERDKKKTVSFTVDQSVYETFCRLSDTMAINKSKFVENKIKEFIEKNS